VLEHGGGPLVVGVALERDVILADPLLEDERARPDWALAEVLALRLTAAGETMPRKAWLAPSRKPADATLNRTRTVCSSTRSAPAYGPRRAAAKPDFVSGSAIRSNANFTAVALNGVPSWNLTPRRSLNV
jgi:hypothetical protein